MSLGVRGTRASVEESSAPTGGLDHIDIIPTQADYKTLASQRLLPECFCR